MESTISISNSQNISTEDNKHNIYLKDKYGVHFLQPMVDKNSKLLSVENTSIIVNSIISDGRVSIYDNTNFKLLKKFEEYELVAQVDFSPGNKHLVIIQKPSINNNLKIIDLTTYQNVVSFHSTTHPNKLWPQIKFSSDGKYLFKVQKGELDIFNFKLDDFGEKTKIFTSEDKYGSINGIINYDISEISMEQLTDTAVICGRVITDEKTKKKKSLLSVYRLSDLSKPIKEMSVSICDRMNIKVSPDKKYVLVHSISDDTSSSSYYGESTLYYMDLLYGKFQKISLANGPIHDFDWTPDGKNFIVCAGHHPAKTNIYSCDAKFLKEICVSKVNTVRISPDSRILCLAGFGNLNGDIEIYNLATYTLIGKTKLYCGVTLNWSRDSKFLVGAVLSPRVRVDNEYRIFTYNGEETVVEKFDGEVYECDWINNETINYSNFEIEVSKVYIEQEKKRKELEKTKPKNTLTYSFNNMNLGPNKGKGGIPGLKKK